MSSAIDYLSNTASGAQVADHLLGCDSDFVPPLSGRVEIGDYAQKIVNKATRFEAWSGGILIGLVAAYCNDSEKRIAYITSVSVLHEWTSRGIATRLVSHCVEHARASGMLEIRLDVATANRSAIKLYEKGGFIPYLVGAQSVTMTLHLASQKEHEQRS